MVFSLVKILSALLAFYDRIWWRPHWRVCREAGAAARVTASLWRGASRAGGRRAPPPGARPPGRGHPRSWGGRGWGAWWGSRGRSTAGSWSPGAWCCCCCYCSPSPACGGQPANSGNGHLEKCPGHQISKYLDKVKSPEEIKFVLRIGNVLTLSVSSATVLSHFSESSHSTWKRRILKSSFSTK